MLPDSLQSVQLAWAFLALPIIALYYWTFRRQREEVASFALWTKALARRSAWSRWRRLVSLGVQLTALALLVAGLARLDWSPRARGIRTIVMVIDTSAGMKATDVAPSRFATSVSEARRVVSGLARDERAAIVASGSVPSILSGPTEDKARLTQLLDKLSCTDEPGNLEPAVELAARMLEGAPNPRVMIFSDGGDGRLVQLATEPNVELRLVNGESPNVAITRLVARPSAVSSEHEILVEATNYSAAAANVRAALSLSGGRLQTVSFELPPGGTARQVIEANLAAGGLLAARLEPGDDFPLDDVAAALIAPRQELTCVLAGNEGSPLAMVLGQIPRLDLQVASDPLRPLPKALVTVFDGPVPKTLPPGGVLVVAPTNSCDLWDYEETVEGRVEIKSQPTEPPLTGVDLSSVVIEELVKLKFKQPTRTLATTASGDPLLSLVSSRMGLATRPAVSSDQDQSGTGRQTHPTLPDGTVLVWHARFDKTDLPQRTVFPLFVSQAVRLLANLDERESRAYRTGQPVTNLVAGTASVGGNSSDAAWTSPIEEGKSAGTPSTLFNEVGVWQLVDKTNAASAVAPVNLFHPGESDLRAVEMPIATSPAVARHWFDAPLWTAFLAAALLLSLVDWLFLHRRALV